MRGVRYIDGKVYLLCGRTADCDDAHRRAAQLKAEWNKVRIIKLNDWDYMLYVHGAK
jgi:hypothetical protein